MKTKNRDFMEESRIAEGLLERVAQLRVQMERADGETSAETLNLYAAQITALSAEAQAHVALAHLYYVTG
jgi:hypothetical protein